MERDSWWSDQTSWCGWNLNIKFLHVTFHKIDTGASYRYIQKVLRAPVVPFLGYIIRTTLSNMTMPVSFWNSHNILTSQTKYGGYAVFRLNMWVEIQRRLNNVHAKPRGADVLDASLLEVRTVFPWHLLNISFIQYTGNQLSQLHNGGHKRYWLSFLISPKSVMYCWQRYQKRHFI